MKSLLTTSAFLLTLTAALPASAADLTLTDGRTFRDATIVSQSPRKVVIKHTEGLSGVEKTLLPADLSARYPIDEAAAREADRKSAEARTRADSFHQAEAERAARIRTEREQAALLLNAQIAAQEAAARLARAEAERLENQRTETVYTYTAYRPETRYIYSPRHSRDQDRRSTDRLCDTGPTRDERAPRSGPGTHRNDQNLQTSRDNSGRHDPHNPSPGPASDTRDLEDKKFPKVATAVVQR